MTINELLEKPNDQLIRDLSTFLFYTLQASFIESRYKSVRNIYLDEVIDEVSHAQYLLNQIVMLDWKPVLSPDQSPHSKEIKKILENDGAEESMDVYKIPLWLLLQKKHN